MAIRVDYLVRETGQNLFRNIMLTIATVVTIAVSLSIFAGVLLMGSAVSNAFKRWNDDVTFIVYMFPDASQDQIDSVGRELNESPQVAATVYFDKQKSYDEARELFADQPAIRDALTSESMVTSFRVRPKNPDAESVRVVADSFAPKPGVKEVKFVQEEIQKVQRAANAAQTWALVVAVVLLVASLLLIFIAIQTAVFSRRREIEVMRLVGATNWFIRVPFILEGLVQGVLGAGAAVALAYVFQIASGRGAGSAQSDFLLDNLRWTDGQFFQTMLLISGIGTLVGAVGAAASVTWYLREN